MNSAAHGHDIETGASQSARSIIWRRSLRSRLMTAHLLVHLRNSGTKQLLRVTAGTLPSVLNVKEFLDLLQTQPEALGTLDEAEPVG